MRIKIQDFAVDSMPNDEKETIKMTSKFQA